MTDAVAISAITGAAAVVGGAVSAYFAYKVKSRVVAVEAKVDVIAEVSEKVHKLVNSAMSTQLQLNAVLARRLADLTKLPADVTAADAAEKTHCDHIAMQASRI